MGRKLHKRLKQIRRRFARMSPEKLGLYLLAVYNMGYRDGVEDGKLSTAQHLKRE